MNLIPVVLEGERVQLIPMETVHIEALLQAALHPDIWSWMEPVTDLRSAERYVAAAQRDQLLGTALAFVVYDRSEQRIVGSTRLFDYLADHRQLEIGHTWYHPGVWRTRVNTECKYLLLRHCFEQLKLVRVQLKTDLRNERSQQAIARLGAVREGVLRRHRVLHDGYVRDSVMFSVTDAEWPQVKARLESLLSR
ncbi:GNAT family N-acetyltransferase [Paenibacillus athensensis]|uniref:GNAT family N-acetyltransferase n=1 Tax=Paenibacillus athensensis TaxID=1967502 RepID=A0A4Y8PYL8_9BACL|nr:GNAT family protein [Paenibacillus athensensis]MCD1258041.1 GNAT family N-acetyltransferase [Paenibacillus athensensis]